MSQLSPYLLNSLEKLLVRIDKDLSRLQRMRESPRISAETRQEIEKKIGDIRSSRLEITQLMSRLERL